MTAIAAVQTGDRTLELRELPVPDRLAPGEALLRVEGCGICGSDVDQYEGHAAIQGLVSYPTIPGHETVGRIERIHPDAAARWRVGPGDRVAVVAGPTCGVCDLCRLDRSGWRPCPNGVTYGFRSTAIGSGLWGGFSEVLHLLPGTVVMPIPDEIDIRDAVLFNPLAAGFDWVVRAGELQVGGSVLITGAGQRGLASVIASVDAGAEHVIVTGLAADRHKLELARRLGATATIEVEEENVVMAARELTGGRGVDLVVETTPLATQPVLDALAAARWGGRIVLAGHKNGRTPDFPTDTIVNKSLTVTGVLGTSLWANEQAIRTIAAGSFPIAELHSHTFGLDQVEYAVQVLAGEHDGERPLHITITPGRAP